MKKIIFAIIVSYCLSWSGTQAWSGSLNSVATAFAPIESSARATAMGGAYTALSNDANGVLWNPAGLAYMSHRQISAMYANLYGIDNLSNSFVSYAQPDRGSGAAGLVFTNTSVDLGDDEERYSETMLGYTYAKRIGRIASMGLTLKGLLVRSDIKNSETDKKGDAGGGGFDVGVIVRPFTDLAFGFSVRDAYSKIKWEGGADDKLPMQFRLGLAATPVSVPGLAAVCDLAGDEDTPVYDLAIGGEYTIRNILSLRAGLSRVLPDKESRTIPSFGLGVLFYSIQFNYAYTDDGNIGSTSRFDLKILF